jgi:hypothetical protein
MERAAMILKVPFTQQLRKFEVDRWITVDPF